LSSRPLIPVLNIHYMRRRVALSTLLE
jgi:hypothetical protein